MVIDANWEPEAHITALVFSSDSVQGPVGCRAVVPAFGVRVENFAGEGVESEVIAVELEFLELVDAVHGALVRAVTRHVPFSELADEVWVFWARTEP